MKIKTYYFLLYHNITVDFDSKGHQRHYKKKKGFLPCSDMLAWLALTAVASPAQAASPGLPPAVRVVSGLRPSQSSQSLQCLAPTVSNGQQLHQETPTLTPGQFYTTGETSPCEQPSPIPWGIGFQQALWYGTTVNSLPLNWLPLIQVHF